MTTHPRADAPCRCRTSTLQVDSPLRRGLLRRDQVLQRSRWLADRPLGDADATRAAPSDQWRRRSLVCRQPVVSTPPLRHKSRRPVPRLREHAGSPVPDQSRRGGAPSRVQSRARGVAGPGRSLQSTAGFQQGGPQGVWRRPPGSPIPPLPQSLRREVRSPPPTHQHHGALPLP